MAFEFGKVGLRDIPEEERKAIPDEDFAGKHRSFPIATPEDVEAAVHSIGHAGDDNYSADTIKANIIKIAKRKGFEAHLPQAWQDELEGSEACDVALSEYGGALVVRLGAVVAGQLKRVPLAKLGHFVKAGQKFSITRKTLDSLVRNFRARPADTVIDYEHASEYPEDAQGGPIPAAGWLKSIDDAPDADGVLWGNADFTPRAQQMITQREYRYLSPVIDWGARNKESGEPQGATLTSVALTNRPFLEAMPALVASQNRDRKGAVHNERSKHTVKVILADRAARTVRVVQDDQTEQTLPIEGFPKIVTLPDLKRDAEGRYDFSALADDQALVAGEVFRAHQTQAELDAAVKRGLITPAQRPHYEKLALSDLAGFRELVKTLQPQVDLSERGLGGGSGDDTSDLARATRELEAKVNEKLKDNKNLQYHEALKLVASENPALNRRYTELSRQRMTGRD
jgi:Mu-like prophage I protein